MKETTKNTKSKSTKATNGETNKKVASSVKMPSEKAKSEEKTMAKTKDKVTDMSDTAKKNTKTTAREDEKVKPSARVNKKTPQVNKTAAKGIITNPAYPDVSFPEGGNNGEIVGMSKSPKTKRGK